MPWQEVCTVDLRQEFVLLAEGGSLSFSALCQRYHITRKTGYKWLRRFAQEGAAGLADRSRRPLLQPRRTPAAVECAVLACRQRFPDWGGRKLARVMRDEGQACVPSPSTITAILRRHGALHPGTEPPAANYIRFEHPYPNDLWQMDFKGAFALARGHCHPLTVLDDHSRFALCLAACANERQGTVQSRLIETFEHYGLPLRMSMDNGSPWGWGGERGLTQLTAWLIEQGISVSHSRAYHPQTQGKDERFHRTLQAELLGRRTFADQADCQRAFDPWRQRYNTQRPHEALQLDTPIQHYQPSQRPYQPNRPPYEYAPGDHVRKVSSSLDASFKNRYVFIGQALKGKHVAFRPTTKDGIYTIHYCHQQIGSVDLHDLKKRKSWANKGLNS
jgi:transposase InsO family protein